MDSFVTLGPAKRLSRTNTYRKLSGTFWMTFSRQACQSCYDHQRYKIIQHVNDNYVLQAHLPAKEASALQLPVHRRLFGPSPLSLGPLHRLTTFPRALRALLLLNFLYHLVRHLSAWGKFDFYLTEINFDWETQLMVGLWFLDPMAKYKRLMVLVSF